MDYETTSLDPVAGDIISGHMILTDRFVCVKDSLDFRARPDASGWQESAAEVHGFTLKECLKFPRPEEVAKEIYTWLHPYRQKITMVYHGMSRSFFDKEKQQWSWGAFDPKFLYFLFYKIDKFYRYYEIFDKYKTPISTVDMAKKVLKAPVRAKFNMDKHDVADFRLDTLCKHFDIPLQHHNARSDAEACMQIFKQCKEMEVTSTLV